MTLMKAVRAFATKITWSVCLAGNAEMPEVRGGADPPTRLLSRSLAFVLLIVPPYIPIHLSFSHPNARTCNSCGVEVDKLKPKRFWYVSLPPPPLLKDYQQESLLATPQGKDDLIYLYPNL